MKKMTASLQLSETYARAVSHRTVPGLILGQAMWNLWWAK